MRDRHLMSVHSGGIRPGGRGLSCRSSRHEDRRPILIKGRTDDVSRHSRDVFATINPALIMRDILLCMTVLEKRLERHIWCRLQPAVSTAEGVDIPVPLVIRIARGSLYHVEGVDHPRFIRRVGRRAVHDTPCTISLHRQAARAADHVSVLACRVNRVLASSRPYHPISPRLAPRP